MPYIDQTRRNMLTCEDPDSPTTPGELNYVLTTICLEYLKTRPVVGYYHYNEVVGALESCKLEFYRRAVAKYESTKIIENGDCY